MKYTGLTVTQFTPLQALKLSGPLPQGRLGELLALDSTTLTRTLGPLARRKFIEKFWPVRTAARSGRALTAGRRRVAHALPAGSDRGSILTWR